MNVMRLIGRGESRENKVKGSIFHVNSSLILIRIEYEVTEKNSWIFSSSTMQLIDSRHGIRFKNNLRWIFDTSGRRKYYKFK